jgi:hypothetical protein
MNPAGLFPFPGPEAIIEGIRLMVEQGITLGTEITRLVTDFVLAVFQFVV